jgi:glycine/D-amino acid oxidase-like deaminating enzyme
VLVVGGGITGVSLMHHLRRRGLEAVLVERDHLAAGASGRNAGFLLAGVAENYAAAVRRYGRARAREIWALTVENHDAMVAAVSGFDVGHFRDGTLILASGPEEAEQLEESAALLVEDGFKAHWDGKALFNPRDGEVNPAALVGALAVQAGVGRICDHVEVTGLEPSSGGDVLVHSHTHSGRAGIVILATNAYTPLLVPSVQISPVRAQMLATLPLEGLVVERPTYSHLGYRYWRQVVSGELLVGGWRDVAPEVEVGYDQEPTETIQAQLDAHLVRLGVYAPVEWRWAGTMGFTESGLPLVGPVEGMKNVYVCGGYNGHGLGFAFVSARNLIDSL